MAAGEAGGIVLGKSADKLFSLSGLFAVYKPKGPTSAGVLNLLKEKLLAVHSHGVAQIGEWSRSRIRCGSLRGAAGSLRDSVCWSRCTVSCKAIFTTCLFGAGICYCLRSWCANKREQKKPGFENWTWWNFGQCSCRSSGGWYWKRNKNAEYYVGRFQGPDFRGICVFKHAGSSWSWI